MEIDIKFKTYGDGYKSGPWVKLDVLPEDYEGLKPLMGKSYHMTLIEIDHGGPDTPCTDITEGIEIKPKENPVKEKRKMGLSEEAHFMISQPSFWDYVVNYRYDGPGVKDYQSADKWLKEKLDISSKSYLDREMDYFHTINEFIDIRDSWRKYVNSK